MTELEPLAIGIPEAIRVAGVGRTKLYAEIAAGKIKIRKSGRRTLIEPSELRRYIEALPTSGSVDST